MGLAVFVQGDGWAGIAIKLIKKQKKRDVYSAFVHRFPIEISPIPLKMSFKNLFIFVLCSTHWR